MNQQACWPQKRLFMTLLPWQKRLVQPGLSSQKRMVPVSHWIMLLHNNCWELVIKRKNIRYEYQRDFSLKWWLLCFVWNVNKFCQTRGTSSQMINDIHAGCSLIELLYIFGLSLQSYNLHVINKFHVCSLTCRKAWTTKIFRESFMPICGDG